ncbi:MAG: hypothetical protein IPF57_22535 [Gammaproteobacteria bacterium]|nr:hypothetical protein [Gammaproteobacteria bacterium]
MTSFAACVARERVGVLFDLCGHAPGNRLRAFAARLAPLQPSWGRLVLHYRPAEHGPVHRRRRHDAGFEEHCFSEPCCACPARASYALAQDAPVVPSGAPAAVCWQFQPPLEAGR